MAERMVMLGLDDSPRARVRLLDSPTRYSPLESPSKLALMDDPLDLPKLRLVDPMVSPVTSPFASPRAEIEAAAESPEAPIEKTPLHSEPVATLFSSWCVLTNTLLGVGLLGLPAAVSHMGLAAGGACLFTAGFLAAFALHLLSKLAIVILRGSQGPADVTFYSVCMEVAPSARYFVDAAISIKCFGVATSYLQVIGQLGTRLVADFFGHSTRTDSTRCLIILAVVLFVLAPTVFHKTITKTSFQNLIAIFSWLYISVLVTAYSLGLLELDEQHAGAAWHFGPPSGVTAQSVLSSLPVFVFSFTCHQNLFPIASELRRRTTRRLDAVLVGAIVAGFLIYSFAGLGGYILLGDRVGANLLADLPPSWPVLLGRCLVVIAVTFTYPLQLHPCRRSLMILAECWRDRFFSRREARLWRRTLTVCILVGTSIVAFLVTDLGVTLAVVGAVGSNTIVLIMPAFLYLRMFSQQRGFLWYCAALLFVTGVVMLPTCLTAIVLKMLA